MVIYPLPTPTQCTHRMPWWMMLVLALFAFSFSFFFMGSISKQRQNRSVSSAAADATVELSGLMVKFRTLAV